MGLPYFLQRLLFSFPDLESRKSLSFLIVHLLPRLGQSSPFYFHDSALTNLFCVAFLSLSPSLYPRHTTSISIFLINCQNQSDKHSQKSLKSLQVPSKWDIKDNGCSVWHRLFYSSHAESHLTNPTITSFLERWLLSREVNGSFCLPSGSGEKSELFLTFFLSPSKSNLLRNPIILPWKISQIWFPIFFIHISPKRFSHSVLKLQFGSLLVW